MSEIMEPRIEEQPGEKLSWSKVWISVITRPSTQTFEWILRDPQASPRRAYLWVFICALIGGIITSVYSMLGFTAGLGEFESSYLYLICTPVIAAVSVLLVAFYAWLTQSIASRFFGGTGTYASMVYATAGYLAPMSLISSLISGIPLVNCLGIFLAIYYIVLGVISVKAVNKIGWGQAAISYFALPVLVFGITFVLTICVLVLLGPAISNVFENIILESGGVLP